MSQLIDVEVPNIDTDNLNNSKYVKKIVNYLQSLDESLRYALGNIDDENITKKFIEDLVVGHLLITNGDNSLIGSPVEGFKMLTGTKIIINFDIKTGEATFGGKVIGGSIESENYSVDTNGDATAGMKIDLTNGKVNSKYFILDENLARFIGNIMGSTITGSKFYRVVFWDGQEVTLCSIDDFGLFHYASDSIPVQFGYVNQSGYIKVLKNSTQIGKPGEGIAVNDEGVFIENGVALHSQNYGSYISTNQITPNLTEYGNIDFAGSENAAAVNWVQANFSPLGHSHSEYATNLGLSITDALIRDWVTANFEPKA